MIKLKQTIYIGFKAWTINAFVQFQKIALAFIAVMSLTMTKVRATPSKNCRSSTIFVDPSPPTDVHFKYFTTLKQTVTRPAVMLSRVIS